MPPETATVEGKRFICQSVPDTGPLVQERFPVSWYPCCRTRNGLIFRMRMRRKQLHTIDHRLLVVIVEPILTRLEAGNDRMPGGGRVPGCMLAGRTVAATDVPTLRAAAEVKPPTSRRRQAFHTTVSTWLRSGINPTATFLHLDSSFRRCMSSNAFKPAARPSLYHPFLRLPGPLPLH
jgi:hypothetical protein